MKTYRCGIYQIQCLVSKKSYVGSSKRIEGRWYEHRYLLKKGTHTSPRLQQAWTKHGEANFVFSILEECSVEKLFEREQHYIDLCRRDYNSMPQVRVITPEMRTKMNTSMAAIAALRTHCPHGHEYTETNTYLNKKREKICRACNRERVARIYVSETPEQTKERLNKSLQRYLGKNREVILEQRKQYRERTKEQKKLYDLAYRPIKNARRRVSSS